MKKIKIYPYDVRQGVNVQPIPVDADRVLANDVVFEGEPGAGRLKLWLCVSTYGPMGVVWANSDEDALHELVDRDLANAIKVDESSLTPEDEEHVARLGNHDVPCDLDNVSVQRVHFVPERDWRLMCKFAEARGAGHDNLDF